LTAIWLAEIQKVPDKIGIGGDGGIRTLDRALQPYNGLANRRLQPLGHVSGQADMPDTAPSRKRPISFRANSPVRINLVAYGCASGSRFPAPVRAAELRHLKRPEFVLGLQTADFRFVFGAAGNRRAARRACSPR
jgi:hypothetical protein